MKKIKLLFATALLLCTAGAWAQTNLIAGWDGGDDTSSPSNFGWTSSANRTLNARNASGGIRMTTTYSGYKDENGNNYTYSSTSDPSSVIFWVRYNTSGESFTYTFNGLEPNHYYSFSGLVGWHNNSSNPTFSVKLNDGSNDLASMSKSVSTKQKLFSVSSDFKAPSTITNTTDIKLIFTCNIKDDCMEAISGLRLVEDYAAYEVELSRYIAYANQLISKLSDSKLATAISTAQEIADDGIDNATFDNVDNLKAAISAAISAYSLDPAGDDVTNFIFRPGFEGMTPESTNYSTVKGKDYSSEGWTMVETGDWGYGAIMSYGSDNTFNNASVPATDNAGNTGNTLGVSVGWGWTQRYQSEVITLPAGSYRFSVKAYNANADAQQFTSKVGFVPTSGDPLLSTKTSFASNTWETDEVDFVLASDTEGRFQIGGTAVSGGSGSNAKIFFDNMSLTYFDPLKLAQIQWQEVYNALDALDATALPDAAETTITNALGAAEPTTVDDYNTAKAALQALIDSYNGIKVAYDKALALITLATNEMTNSTGTKTTIEAAITTATADIESRTAAADLVNDYNILETARQTYVTSGAQPTAAHVFDYTFKVPDAAVTSSNDWTDKRTNTGEQYTGAPDNTYFDNYNENRNIKKNIGALRLGCYELKCATRAHAEVSVGNIYVSQNGANLNQTNINHVGNTGGDLENGWSWTTVNFDNFDSSKDITLGFYSECGSGKWSGADDFHLYYKGNAIADDVANALKETVVSGKMNATVESAQSSALSAFESEQIFENYNTLKAAIDAANASKTAYAKLKTELDKIPSALGTTNVYTASSYETNYKDVLASYNDNSISTDDANAYAYGERVTGAMPAIMLSSWKVGETAALTDASLYMNTWSTEGNSDGSEMTTPFYEYWVSDDDALAEKSFTATVEGLTAETNYLVTAKVRVRQQNDQTKADDDVTFQVNDGDVVNAANGTQSDVRPEMYYKTVRALGTADGDGKLAIKVIVKEGNHVSWLAFKDVHYSEVSAPTNEHKTALSSAITTAESKTIGFAEGEYAPYTNIDARKALAAAKVINDNVNDYTDYEVVATTTALTGATWTANAEEMNAVSDELFNGTEYGAAGWTRSVTWNNVGGDKSYSIPAGTMTYGDLAYHEMPLEGNTVYKLTFGHRRWDGGNADNGGQVSVLNGSDEGLALTSYTGTSEQSLQNEYYYFRTGAAGNYTFTVTAANGRLTFGNLVIKKAVAEDLTIDEKVDYTPVKNYANITLARTIKADTWNTFVVPFALNYDELKDAFGSDVEVAEFSDSGESSDAVTVSFTKMGTPAITANTPVLLKTSTAGTSYSFTGRTVVAGTPAVTCTYLDFVGTYTASTTIASGDFFISGNKLYKSSGATTIQGTRAYLHDKSGAGVKAMLFIDDEATSIDAINGVEAENGVIYNIAGQRLNKVQKGINIVNGKKVLY